MCVCLGFAYIATDGIVLLLKDKRRLRVTCSRRRHRGEEGELGRRVGEGERQSSLSCTRYV